MWTLIFGVRCSKGWSNSASRLEETGALGYALRKKHAKIEIVVVGWWDACCLESQGQDMVSVSTRSSMTKNLEDKEYYIVSLDNLTNNSQYLRNSHWSNCNNYFREHPVSILRLSLL